LERSRRLSTSPEPAPRGPAAAGDVRSRLAPWLTVIASGTLHFLGFAGFGLWPLCFVALVPHYRVLERETNAGASAKRVFALGALHGFVAYAGGYYWLETMLETFSGYGPVASAAFASIFWVYQGGQIALLALAYRFLRSRGAPTLAAILPPFVLLEWAYPQLFPSYMANALHSLPHFLQVVDLGGPLLLSAVIGLVNAAIFELLRAYRAEARWALAPLGLAAAAVTLTLAYGAYRMHQVAEEVAAAPKLNVGLVQVDMGLFAKRGDPEEGLRRHIQQSLELERSVRPDLLIWPESAYTFFVPESVRNVKRLVLGPLETPVLFGGLSRRFVDGESRHYNTAFLADGEGELLGTYDKTYLLAFGEYLPFGELFPQIYELSPNTGHFTHGSHVRPLAFGAHRIGTLICYEDVLPEFTRRMVREGNPDLLVNITNDAWFGDTQEPWVHLALAKFRAVEHHRFLVRATNSGVSAVVDPVGRVLTHSGVFERASLSSEVAMLEGQSLYAVLGPWPGYLALVACGLLAFRYRRRTTTR
jgi:apolipoprotein N-acyltransferase